jgi:phage shock protein A
MGNMREIQQQAAQLIEIDQKYQPFAGKLKQLADEYQSKAVLAFIKKYRNVTC